MPAKYKQDSNLAHITCANTYSLMKAWILYLGMCNGEKYVVWVKNNKSRIAKFNDWAVDDIKLWQLNLLFMC